MKTYTIIVWKKIKFQFTRLANAATEKNYNSNACSRACCPFTRPASAVIGRNFTINARNKAYYPILKTVLATAKRFASLQNISTKIHVSANAIRPSFIITANNLKKFPTTMSAAVIAT